MRKLSSLVLCTLALIVGTLIGSVDSRSTHLAIKPAHAQPKKVDLGCDGHGAPATCAACPDGGTSCALVCVGALSCSMRPTRRGTFMCIEGTAGCASGGTKLSDFVVY